MKRVNKDIEEKDDGLFPPKSQTAVTVEGWCQLFCWLNLWISHRSRKFFFVVEYIYIYILFLKY